MKSRFEEAYPNFLLDLNQATDEKVEAITASVIADLPYILEDASEELLNGIRKAIDAYLYGAIERADQRTEIEDNLALERVSDRAESLCDALMDLIEHPGTEPRLERSIRQNRNLHRFASGTSLDDLIGSRYNIFFGFRDMLVDLRFCAENEINRMPKEIWLDGVDEDEAPLRLDTDEELKGRLRSWRARSKARKFEKDHALLCFLEALRPYWEKATPLPFSEGMHYREIGDTLSPLVDLTEKILNKVDADVTRSKIVNGIRKFRKLERSKAPS